MIYNLPSIENADIKGKTVAIWTNLNTEVNGSLPEHNFIARSTIQTISYLLTQNCKIIIMGSYGDPKSVSDDHLSLMDVRFAIGNLLAKPTKFVNILNSLNSIKFMNEGELLFLENLKFNSEETSTNPQDWEALNAHLLKLVDAFVIDTVDIDYTSGTLNYLWQNKPTYLGLNLVKEFSTLKGLLRGNTQKKILILGSEINNIDSDEIQEMVNAFDKVFTIDNTIKIKDSLRINTISQLKTEIESTELVIWIGELDKDGQDVLECLSLSVGKGVTKILGGRKLVERLKYSKFKEKSMNLISTSGHNLVKLLLGKEIVLS